VGKHLIIGGAGFIGSNLSRLLCEQGEAIHILDNLSLGRESHVHALVEAGKASLQVADATIPEDLNTAFTNYGPFDDVYHLAANSDIQKSATNPDIELQNTFLTTYQVLSAMRRFACKKLVFSSTSAIYGDKQNELIGEDCPGIKPISYYGGAKLASEAFISSFAFMNDMQVWICRFPNVVGDNATHGAVFDFIQSLRLNKTQLTILGDGSQTKPYLYVRDLVDAILYIRNVAHNAYNVFNIGVDSATSVDRIAHIVTEEMNLPDVTFHYTGGNVGWKGDVPRFSYDNSRLRGLGWKPAFESDEAVRLATRAILSGTKD